MSNSSFSSLNASPNLTRSFNFPLIGKSNSYYLPIHLLSPRAPMDSQTVVLIVNDVQLLNADRNVQKACHSPRHIERMFADTPVLRMVPGEKEFIQEFIEISKL